MSKKRERVGLLHYSAPPIIGGVESTVAFQARFLAEAGVDPVVIAGAGGPLPDGIELRLIPPLGSRHPDVLAAKADLDRGQVGPGFDRLRGTLRDSLAPALADLKTVLVHNALSLHKNLALTSALWELADVGPQFLAWHHDLAWDRPDYAAELHPGDPWDLLRRPFPGATHVAVSLAVRERVARVFSLSESEVVVIPPGVDAPAFQGWTAAMRRLEAALGLTRADALFLLPSRITRRKNIEFAIRVTAEARRLLGDVRLLVTGPPGPHNPANQAYLEELLALVRRLDLGGSVHFLHRTDPDRPADLDDATLAALFRLCDALLFTSRDEGFGIPVLEAGLSRMPVFCTDLRPFRESGGDQVTVFSPDDDPAQVARRIVDRLSSDPAFHLARRVRREFDWAAILADRLLPILGKPSGG